MKRFMLVMIVVAMVAVMLSVASAYYVSYNTNGFQRLITIDNPTDVTIAITYNTRPTTGQGGVHVGLFKKVNNDYQLISGKQFPYFQDVTAMTSYIPSGTVRYIFANPIISGQLVAGNLTYSYSP